MSKVVKVYIRLIFLRIGEIDTLNEKYQAQLCIESRWAVDLEKITPDLSFDDQKRLIEGKSVSLLNYAESHWHPQLYIENTLGDLKEQIRHTAKRAREDHQFYICEHRDVKGVFWEKLELNHFPTDVQDLSISIGSMFYDDKVVLLKDPYHLSGVNREAFVDQQEWWLYEHVDTQQRFVREFLFSGVFDTDEDEEIQEDYDNIVKRDMGKQLNWAMDNEDRKRSILTVTCHAARQANYFYWNGYCLVFLITLLSFCLFAIPPQLAPNRIQASCTLLLTSITFRWTVNRSLPTISYLTLMDKYAIMCMFILVILCIWHTTMSALVFNYTTDLHVTPEMWLSYLDRRVFTISALIFLLIHVLLLAWMYFVPLEHQRRMARRDVEYRQLLEKSLRQEKLRIDRNFVPIIL